MSLLDLGRDGRPLAGLDVIDMHGHLGRCGFAIPDLSPEGMVAVMDRVGISRIMCSHMQSMGQETRRGNDEVLAAMRAFPGRILGYASAWPSDRGAVRAEIERCLAAGFTGLKVHDSNGFAYTYEDYAPAFAIADAHRWPVLLHVWGGDDQLAQVAELAARYPHASFLLAHAGCRNVEGYVRIAREHANVYLDLALSSSPRGLVALLVQEAGADKVVWGSDAYFFNQGHQVGKVLGAELSEEVKAQVLSGNAKRLLARVRPAA
jgi:predicted TIM-barrel fold metal-dependent hydrolase